MQENTGSQPSSNAASKEIVSRRSIIISSGRVMFLWVAGASVLVVAALVVLFYVFKQFSFNNEVITAKWKASDTLKSNVTSYKELKKNVDNLVANDALASVRNPNGDNLQTIVDALPVSEDTTAFAVSLQNIIAPRSAVALQSVMVPPSDNQTPDGKIVSVSSDQPVELTYNIESIGSYESTQSFLVNLERTIRPVYIKSIELTGSDATLRTVISLKTYYQPAKDVNVTMKDLKFNEKN